MTAVASASIQAIQRCKYRYLRALDQKDWDTLADTLTDDVSAAYGGGAHTASGRDAVMAFLRDVLGDERILTSHRVHHPEIELFGDGRATAVWAMDDVVIHQPAGVLISGAGFYEDELRRCADGQWRICVTGYRRTYEQMVPTASMPGWQLTASWWETNGRSLLG
ncbi:MAG: nuclear transport factor 2 family protein [Acidimicrobiia bacterium]|nr:nuclear transport factor 2 family protein [Acidimicrobiia bacterium]